jgi:hypothetical protein
MYSIRIFRLGGRLCRSFSRRISISDLCHNSKHCRDETCMHTYIVLNQVISWLSDQTCIRASDVLSVIPEIRMEYSTYGDSGLSDPNGRYINDIDFIQEELSRYRIRGLVYKQ